MRYCIDMKWRVMNIAQNKFDAVCIASLKRSNELQCNFTLKSNEPVSSYANVTCICGLQAKKTLLRIISGLYVLHFYMEHTVEGFYGK